MKKFNYKDKDKGIFSQRIRRGKMKKYNSKAILLMVLCLITIIISDIKIQAGDIYSQKNGFALSEINSNEWIDVYYNFITRDEFGNELLDNGIQTVYGTDESFALVYIDNDDIPELIWQKYSGWVVMGCKDGKSYSKLINSVGDFSYVPKRNVIMMKITTYDMYDFGEEKDELSIVKSGVYAPLEGFFHIDGRDVTEEEFKKAFYFSETEYPEYMTALNFKSRLQELKDSSLTQAPKSNTSSDNEQPEISIKAEKDKYEKNEEIHLNVTMKNNTTADFSNIKFSVIAPKEYKAEIDSVKEMPSLKQGEEIRLQISVVNLLAETNETEQKNTNEIEVENSSIKKEASAKKETSSNYKTVLFIIAGVCAVLLVILTIILILLLKKRKNSMISSIIILALLASYLLPLQIYADMSSHIADAYETVVVEDEEVEFGIQVTYETEEKESMPMLTSDEITLTYQLWEDGPVAKSLVEEWNKIYPNITIYVDGVTTADNNQNLMNYMGTSQMPDVFWVLGTPDFAISRGMLSDLSSMWESDKDTQNVIGGINEFKLGYLNLDQKWTTPVKFFPTEAWLNMNYFKKRNIEMPSADWTFEEMQQCVQNWTVDNYGGGWGISEAVTVITWYPIASDPDCIGEFGWNGNEFDLTGWANGMLIEKEWRESGYKAPDSMEGLPGYEDGGAYRYPQDEGLVAMNWDSWWCWERYWDKDEMYAKQVYYVPYMLPHTAGNSDSDTYLAIMDFGGIYSGTSYQREAYEVLKFFTWGPQGWKYKISKCDEIIASIKNNKALASVSGLASGPLNNCPITTDKKIWEAYEKKHPTTVAGGDIEGAAMGIDRTSYFDAFFEKVKTSKWTCYGSGQIPGFDTWLADNYNSATLHEGYAGVESWVFEGNGNPYEKVQLLTGLANETYREFKKALEY